MSRAFSAAIGVLLVSIAACNGVPDTAKQLAMIRSWTATIQLAAREHSANALPNDFTTRLTADATTALGHVLRQRVQRGQHMQNVHPNPDSGRVNAATDSLAHAIRNLNSQIGSR
jgi:hypothetical protein